MFQPQPSFVQQKYHLYHYKNCIFHGQITKSLKQNVCMLFMDNGEVLIGNFKNDQLNGDCIVFIDPETYVIGTFTRGLLDGNFVLRNPKMTIYWTVKMNKIKGEITVIIYDQMLARTWVIQNGQGHCTQQIQIDQMDKQNKILSKISPYTQPLPLSLGFLAQKFTSSLTIQTSVSQTTKFFLPSQSFYKLKITIFKDHLIQYGVYHDNELNGLGFSMQGGNLLQGKFKSGKLDGNALKIQNNVGINYVYYSGKIIYGTFKSGDIRTIDVLTNDLQNARKQLKTYKKQLHIYSLQFVNNYFNERPILMLQNLLRTIQTNELNFTKQLRVQQQISMRNQRTFQKTKDVWKGSGSIRAGFNASNRKQNTLLQSQINQNHQNHEMSSGQKHQSRFKATPNQNIINGSNEKETQFYEGIKEYNLINKALRKFK